MANIPAIGEITDISNIRVVLLQSGSFVSAPLASVVNAAGTTMNADTDVSGNSWVLDEDDMASDSATKLPTQQSVKAYVDASSGNTYVSTRTALKALDTTKDTVAILTESGREGIFLWRTGDFASMVTADATEGLYVKADAIATTAGAWVRQRKDLDVQAEWFGAIVGASAGANAATNDAALASAKALSSVSVIKFLAGIYEFSTTISVDRSGLGLQGYAGFPVFGTGGSVGTILKWTGSSGSTGILVENSTTDDIHNPRINDLELDGNALLAVGIDVVAAQFPQVFNVSVRNLQTTGTPIGLRTGSKSGTAAEVNCTYRGSFRNIALSVSNSGIGLYCTGKDTISGANTTFCVFENVHIVHDDGAGFYINAADDCTFLNCATSRLAGGTGNALYLDGNNANGKWVVAMQFYGFQAGATDGSTAILADGVRSRQNKIYGLSGVDDVPTITQSNGAQLFTDYLGSGYSSDKATEGAVSSGGAIRLPNYPHADHDVLDFFKQKSGAVTITFGGAAVGVTYSANFYRACRIGDMVLFKAQLVLTNKGSSTGAAVIGGLPWSTVDGFACSIYATGMTSGVGDTQLTAFTNLSSLVMYKQASGSLSSLTNADFTNTSTIVISGVYQTSDTTE